MVHDYLIVGAGIVGLATAHRLQQRFPHAALAVIEKETRVAAHQSGHNSGVVHAGVYYPPGSMKARLCRAGAAATFAFCAEHGVPHQRCGKLIVATGRHELPRLEALAARARGNGLEVERLDAAQTARREPRVRALGALYVPASGIADYPALCARLAALIVAAGGTLTCATEVVAIREEAGGVVVATTQGDLRGRRLVVCGGLQSDRLARLAGLPVDFAVVPFRGDYFRLPPARSDLVSTLIYPVPDERLPFLGIHLTRTTDGGITLGPSAMLALAREAYRPWGVNARDARDLLAFPGTWRLLARFAGAGVSELGHALSRRAYLAAARRYCPGLELGDLATPTCGIRAQAVNRAGELLHDFVLLSTARSVHVGNAPSPAATSAFPIAEAIIERLTAGA